MFQLDAQPTDGEREVWNQVNAVLQDSESMLSDLQSYKGAGQEIREVRYPCYNLSIFSGRKITCVSIAICRISHLT